MTSGAGGGSGHTRRGVVRSHTVISRGAEAAEAAPTGTEEDETAAEERTRTRPRIDMATLLSVDPTAPVAGLHVQARRVVALLVPGVLSVADICAALELPAGMVRAVVADLVVGGHVHAADPFVAGTRPHERDFLERVLHGLQRL